MTEYRRTSIAGGTYFFTVNCAERHNNHLLTENISTLRLAFRKVMHNHPFTLDAIVVLPEHLHCIITLPPDDADYKTRWSLIKSNFSRAIHSGERISESRHKRGERGIWQRRYWEHLIRDDKDFAHHLNYIHWNPVKHGWVKHVMDWPYSSFHAYRRRGVYSDDWACDPSLMINIGE